MLTKEDYEVWILGLVLILSGFYFWNHIEEIPIYHPELDIYIMEPVQLYTGFCMISLGTGVCMIIFFAVNSQKSNPTQEQIEEYYS